MKHLKPLRLNEEYDILAYEEHWIKFRRWLNKQDFDLYDGEEDLKQYFLKIANEDLAIEEKSEMITSYMEEKWGLYDGYQVVLDYLEKLFWDEV